MSKKHVIQMPGSAVSKAVVDELRAKREANEPPPQPYPCRNCMYWQRHPDSLEMGRCVALPGFPVLGFHLQQPGMSEPPVLVMQPPKRHDETCSLWDDGYDDDDDGAQDDILPLGSAGGTG